ncbi:MAG: hypothetical protein EA370_09260 [Wenzhouxiangella sp.]|nr:MAG: hypothetical protein EA370_09260 [Wenzhouxiangella sp.]
MAQFFTPVWSGRLALLASAVLALLAVWLLVRLVWLVLAGPQVESAPVPPVPRGSQVAADTREFRWDLFGPQQRTNLTPVRPVETTTRSNLRLLGVMTGDTTAYAFIADAQGRESVYRRGDELPDGTVLEQIEAQRVILARNGRSEALELDRDRPAAGQRGGTASTAPARSAAAPIHGLRGFDTERGVSVAAARDMGATGLDVGNLAQSISVMPVSGGGFRVRPGRDARLFAQLGLQINDVVTAVNGQPLESEDAARALFADVLRRGEVAITVNRQGREMTLRPDLEQIIGSLQNP